MLATVACLSAKYEFLIFKIKKMEKVTILISKINSQWGFSIGEVVSVYNKEISDYFSISNRGGLKFEIKEKVDNISNKKFDTYEIIKFKGRNMLIFTKYYDENKAFEVLKNALIIDIENEIQRLKSVIPLINNNLEKTDFKVEF